MTKNLPPAAMKPMQPSESLRFFQENLPQFLQDKKYDLQTDINELITILKRKPDDSYDADVLRSVKKLYNVIITTSIEVLSKTVQAPYHKSVDIIKEHIDSFSRFEELIMGFDPKYRDHLCHSFWVYLFGHEMILSMSKSGYEAIKIAGQVDVQYQPKGESPGFRIGSEQVECEAHELEAMWAVIALLHDIGYPVERVSNGPSELFGKLVEPFGIDANSSFQINFGSRLFMLYESIGDLLSITHRPKPLNDAEEKQHHEMAIELKQKTGLILRSIRKPTAEPDEELKIEFKIASVNREHSAWGAVFAYKNIPFLHPGKKAAGDLPLKRLMIARDILYSIVHHTNEQPHDDAVNRFQFILLLIDDIEECNRYSKGGRERGRKREHANVNWTIQEDRMQVELEFENNESASEAASEKYRKLCRRYDYQKALVIGNYPILMRFFQKEHEADLLELKLLLIKDQVVKTINKGEILKSRSDDVEPSNGGEIE